MAYTRTQIIESILFQRGIYKKLGLTPEQVKAHRTNYNKGIIKESTIKDILTRAGFIMVQEEQWELAPKAKP